MKIIKLFDWQEIKQDTGVDFFEYWWKNYWAINYDSVISWCIEDNLEDTDEDSYKIDQYFITKGCVKGERVLIDVYY